MQHRRLFNENEDLGLVNRLGLSHEIGKSLSLDVAVETSGNEILNSRFAVSELAVSSIGAVGSAVASLIADTGLSHDNLSVRVDQRLAALWFSQSIYPRGWRLPPVWDAVAGDYQTADGWIKLHTNLAHHREAALRVLGVNADRDDVASNVSRWKSDELESAIVNAGGVAAMMRSRSDWQNHPQGIAVASEPLVSWGVARAADLRFSPTLREQPLAGLRVLDLTRVLAGPVATRTLAGLGADVLRIDPPGWDEPFVVPDISLGKRCAFLDLKRLGNKAKEDRATFETLLSNADVLVHGYRPGALDDLGYDLDARRSLSPTLIEVSLNAYGQTGPWCRRRGFDSLVQMSCGIADAGMHWAQIETPKPLPVQALDHATGYLMAATVIRLLSRAVNGHGIANASLSLARTAELLMSEEQSGVNKFDFIPSSNDLSPMVEATAWGKADRLRSPLTVDGCTIEWRRAANNLGTSEASWLTSRFDN